MASYPFVERARSHALTSEGREPWGAFAPATDAMKAEYSLREVFGATDVDALWSLWRQRVRELEPKAAPLTASLTDITAYRVQALLPYYAELEPRRLRNASRRFRNQLPPPRWRPAWQHHPVRIHRTERAQRLTRAGTPRSAGRCAGP